MLKGNTVTFQHNSSFLGKKLHHGKGLPSAGGGME